MSNLCGHWLFIGGGLAGAVPLCDGLVGAGVLFGLSSRKFKGFGRFETCSGRSTRTGTQIPNFLPSILRAQILCSSLQHTSKYVSPHVFLLDFQPFNGSLTSSARFLCCLKKNHPWRYVPCMRMYSLRLGPASWPHMWTWLVKTKVPMFDPVLDWSCTTWSGCRQCDPTSVDLRSSRR